MKVPEKWKAVRMPPNMDAKTDSGTLFRDSAFSENTVTIQSQFEVRKPVIPAQEYKAFKALWDSYTMADANTLVFQIEDPSVRKHEP